jgi:putative DNA primase/helicase
MKPSDFRQAADIHFNGAAATVPARADAIVAAGDAMAAYAKDFIDACACLDEDTLFSVKTSLSKLKEFSKGEFNRRIKDTRMEAMQPKANGHAGGQAWEFGLLANDKGVLKPCHENVALHIENHEDWKGVLSYNEFTGGHDIMRQPPEPVTAKAGEEIEDHFDTEATRWFERRNIMVKPDTVRRVIDSTSRARPYHPVRNYFNNLPAWDGILRMDSWLIDYCGVKSTESKPNVYAMAVGDKFLISAVARIFQPGCKADYLIVLEGPQRTGKSTVVKTLASDEWFTDQLTDLGGKDASMKLRGVWILEFGELDAFGRTEITHLKSFLTQQFERFRLPYGKRIVKWQRQCVFIGTTNVYNWNKDPTGAGRFWPVRCGDIDIPGLTRDRDQLWAEALYKYRRGDYWYITDPEILKMAKRQQKERFDPEVWREKIREAIPKTEAGSDGILKEGSVSVAEILNQMGIKIERQDQIAANRVARTLIADGWEQYRDSAPGRPWRYRRETEPDEDLPEAGD